MDFDLEFDDSKSPLTKKENQVYRLLVEGHETAVMVAIMHRSINTLNRHLTHIYMKLDVSNRSQAITAGWVRGMVRARQVLLWALVLVSSGNAVLPTSAMADDFMPVNRVRVRGGRQLRTGNQMRLRTPSKRKRDDA